MINVLNKRQQVRDSFGNTPLQFQPGYRDPLGRTIEVRPRKVSKALRPLDRLEVQRVAPWGPPPYVAPLPFPAPARP